MRTCQSCLHVGDAEARFCSRCGQALPLGEAPEGDRRVVTVLFADVSGFTAMSEKLDPEAVAEIVNQCFAALSEPVYRHGGVIDKYMGDALMALFGAPSAHEDDPRRALAAALEMQQIAGGLSQDLANRHGVEVRLRIGLNTGLVVAGAVGGPRRRDYTVMGDAVNLAQRMEAHAPPGTILVTEQTALLAHEHFRFAPRPPLRVKGKRDPVRVFALIEPLEVPPAADHALTAGREADLELLRSALSRTMTGWPWWVLLVGEAGVGKSHLVEAWRREVSQDVRWVAARCPSEPEARGGLVAQIVRAWLGVTATAAPEAMVRALRSALEHQGEGEAEAEGLLGLLLGVPGAGASCPALDASQRSARARVMAQRLILGSARLQPTVLSLDELHHASGDDLGWLDSLALSALEAQIPLMGLFQARPEGIGSERSFGLEIGQRHRLANLERPTARELAQHLAGDRLSCEALEALVARSEGNPMILRELVGAALGGEAFPAGISLTLKALVASRIDRLNPSARAVLEAAAVLGRSFDPAAACEISGLPTIEAHLAQLEACGLARQHDSGEWAFQQQIVAEVAYEQILLRRRKEMHRRAAGYYGRLHADTEWYCALRAEHHLKAGESGKALGLLIQAAEVARRAHAIPVAATHLKRAWAIRTAHPELPCPISDRDLTVRMAQIQANLGDYAAALEGFEAALADPLDDSARAQWLRQLASVHERRGDFARSGEAIDEALGLLGCDHGVARAGLLVDKAWLAVRAGHYREALEGCQHALALLGPEGHPLERARSHSILGIAHHRANRWDQALDEHEAALELRESVGDLAGIAASLNNLGMVEADRGASSRAEGYYARSLSLYQRLGDRGHQATVRNNLGDLAARGGRLEEARRHHQAALAAREHLQDRFGVAASRCALGDVARRAGALDEAMGLLKAGLNDLESIGEGELLGEACEAMGRCEAARGHVAEAERWFQRALRHALRDGDWARRSAVARAQAQMALDIGNRAVARRRLEQAARCLERAENPQARAEHVALEARLLRAEGRLEEALSLEREARSAIDPGEPRLG